METDKQTENTSKPWLWKKGQSGNLAGRPIGKTMKEYAKEYLSKLNDEERDEWLEGLSKETIWKLAEGNPKQDTDVTSGGEKIKFEIINYGENNTDSVRIPAESIPTESTQVQG